MTDRSLILLYVPLVGHPKKEDIRGVYNIYIYRVKIITHRNSTLVFLGIILDTSHGPERILLNIKKSPGMPISGWTTIFID